MKSLYILYSKDKEAPIDPKDKAYEVQDFIGEFNPYDRTMKFRVSKYLDEKIIDKALIPGQDRIVQLYAEEWDIDGSDYIQGEFYRLGYGTLKGLINGLIYIIDVRVEHDDIEDIQAWYADME